MCLCFGVAGSGVGVSSGRYSAARFLGAVAALLGWLVAAASSGGWSGLAFLGPALPHISVLSINIYHKILKGGLKSCIFTQSSGTTSQKAGVKAL